MRLAINGWRLCGPRTGVPRYLLNILRHWTADASTVFREITIYTPRPLDRHYVPLPPNIRERVLGPDVRMLVWENLRLGPVCNADVLFCPSSTRPLWTRSRTVVATHDQISQIRPDVYPLSERLFYRPLYDWSDRHAAAITTLGAAVKDEIVRYCRVPPERVHVVYPAADPAFGPSADTAAVAAVREQYTGGAPFFVFVGKMTGRRRLPCLLEAFAMFKQRSGLPHRLVLVGLNPSGLDLGSLAERLGVGGDVILKGFVEDAELNLVYNAAEALVMPSVYETTSLPLMEAQACGLPVICIETAGLRELTDGTAIHVPVMEPETLAEGMLRVASDASLREELGRRGLENSRRFSWKRCAQETMAVLESVARD